jgi:hypothetical protein
MCLNYPPMTKLPDLTVVSTVTTECEASVAHGHGFNRAEMQLDLAGLSSTGSEKQ